MPRPPRPRRPTEERLSPRPAARPAKHYSTGVRQLAAPAQPNERTTPRPRVRSSLSSRVEELTAETRRARRGAEKKGFSLRNLCGLRVSAVNLRFCLAQLQTNLSAPPVSTRAPSLV